jgi:dihydroflavonol-4-reductase
MKYLVTGGTGLLGNNVVRLLLQQGEQVRVLARARNDSRPLAGLDVDFAHGDVRDAAAVARAIEGMDAVVHCAGYVHIGWTHEADHREVNVGGTENVATAAREQRVRMVHVSSVNALGLGSLQNPADEESALPGIIPCPYVTTKREAEQRVQAEVERGLSAVIVHPSYMLGPWDWKPTSGQMLLECAKMAPFPPIGACSLADARDVAAGILAAARSSYVARKFILGGHNLTYRELFQRFADLGGAIGPIFPAGPVVRAIGSFGGDLRGRITGHEPGVNSASIELSKQEHCFSSLRAETELGYKIRPLDEIIQSAWEWFVENGYVSRSRVQRSRRRRPTTRTTWPSGE